MSNSYRRNYYFKYKIGKGKHFSKRKVRRYKGDIPDGCFYKKLYESYNVIDYYYFYTRKELDQRFRRIKEYIKAFDNLEPYTREQAEEMIEYIEDNMWFFRIRFK